MNVRSARYDPPLQTRAIDLLLLALAVALLPHLTHLPPIVILLCIAFGAWRWLAAHRDWALPGMPTRTVLTLLALSAVILHFGTVFGRDAGAALLAVMLGLKLLEVQRYRDAVIVLFLGYFLTVTMVLFSQEIVVVALLSAALLLITMTLIELNHPAIGARLSLRRIAARSGLLLLQAVPLMLVMFLLFPRLPGPLWGLPDDAYGAMTGLSDSMRPGSISELGQSDRVAFRVRFDDAVPAAESLYWRGPVLWHTDGSEWSIDGQQGLPAMTDAPAVIPRGPSLHYEVTLEPHNRRWLFALEMPFMIPDDSHYTRDLLVLAGQPVRQLTRYRVGSYPAWHSGPALAAERDRGLQLPAANPRTRALGRQWREQSGGDREVIARALDHFREQPFHYTLQPPLLPGSDPIDGFLFDTRRGFCEHYAAAFTILMRAAGIPARVVTGYQGGELNPLGDYLIVRQRDAHAWTEVLLGDSGWVRIDPTAAVAPDRIEQGSGESLAGERGGMLRGFEQGLFGRLARQAGFGWDAVNNRWNQWVLGYGPDSQLALLSRFGLDNGMRMALAMIGAVAVSLALLAMLLLLRRRADGDAAARLYRRFCRRLARRGIVREASEGPLQFAARAGGQRPDQATMIETISRRYAAIRYGGVNTPGQLRRLRRDIARFRP